MADYSKFAGKMPWAKRAELIREQYPSVHRLDFEKVFQQDPAAWGRVVNDILKADLAKPGRPGKRPGLDAGDARIRISQMRDDDYSILPFSQALNILKGTRSLRHMSSNTGVDKMTLHKLLKGNLEPSVEHMEKIAKGLKRHPSYFLEYRVAYITGTLANRMMEYPESSVVQYNKIKKEISTP